MEIQYEVINVVPPKVPPRSLLRISGDRSLTVSLEAFGRNYFRENIAEMQREYSHHKTGEIIRFKEPTTAESILAAAHNFKNMAKLKIFDTSYLQAGWVVNVSEGSYANPPKDAQGNLITDEKTLKSFLKPNKKFNGIYLLDRDFGYAPYESFRQGVQDAKDFAEGGLARLLEHSEKTAEKLGEIASKKNYPRGVNVWRFDPVKTPLLRVASLDSDSGLDYLRLIVCGYSWLDDALGSAFGVCDSGEARMQKI